MWGLMTRNRGLPVTGRDRSFCRSRRCLEIPCLGGARAPGVGLSRAKGATQAEVWERAFGG